MGRAQLVAAVLVAIVVTAAVTMLLAIPALYAHLRGEYRETVTVTVWPGHTTEPFPMTPETVVMWPVPMTMITHTWTDLNTTETYRFCQAIITVTLSDRIIEYYVTCVLPPDTATVTTTVTTTETVATWTITIYTHTHTIGWRTIIPGRDD